MNDQRPQRRRRRFHQFSLRALLVFVLLASVGMSWLAVKMQRARRQKEAVEAIRKAGGIVGYEYQGPDKGQICVTRPEPPVPRWLRELFGDDFFVDVSHVDGRDSTDKTMTYLAELSRLEWLVLSDTQVTDAGLEQLEGLTNLRVLNLRGTQVTDAGLEHVRGLTKLRYLTLTDAQVTDAGLEHVRGLTKLRYLALSGTQVTDAGLDHLSGLTSLQELQLINTRVTDAGLEHLKGLTNLEGLFLWHTQVTPEGVRKLRRALPDCHIENW